MNSGIFNSDFYPTPLEVIEKMLDGVVLDKKAVLEPSAGKGDIVDYLKRFDTEVIACEKSPELRAILEKKCRIIADDFLTVKAEQVSHIHLIVMNPPFTYDEKHILHAWNIAPAGCKVIALCNSNTLTNRRYNDRQQLSVVISEYGYSEELGKVFENAERKTDVEVSLIVLQKPGANYESEFEGFYLDEDPEEQSENAIMPYNFIRDLVNRYINAIKIFDDQLDAALRMNNLISSFYKSNVAMLISEDGKSLKRNEFKKDLQKNAWTYIFNKMDMQKFATAGLRADINKFVEQQQQIPFTMRNIYRMIEIVIGTQDQRMDKALLEVFEKVTKHYHENRFSVEGWKTNSHYLLNRKFIMPHVVTISWGNKLTTNYNGWAEPIEDMHKALCHLTGRNYESWSSTFSYFLNLVECKPGQLYNWGFFEFRAYKKGTVHFTFNNEDVWAKFNQRIAKILGYPLFENTKQGTPGKKLEKPGYGCVDTDKWAYWALRENKEEVGYYDFKKAIHEEWEDDEVKTFKNYYIGEHHIARVDTRKSDGDEFIEQWYDSWRSNTDIPPCMNPHAESEAVVLLRETYDYLEQASEKGCFNTCRRNIRTELARNWPLVKFSVKKTNYSTVRISWKDGPTTKQVDAILGKYEDHVTDETGDFRDYEPTEFTAMFGGAKYVFTEREMSDKTEEVFHKWAKGEYNDNNDFDTNFNCHSYGSLANKLFYYCEIPNTEFKIQQREHVSGCYSPENLWEVVSILNDEIIEENMDDELQVVDHNQLTIF